MGMYMPELVSRQTRLASASCRPWPKSPSIQRGELKKNGCSIGVTSMLYLTVGVGKKQNIPIVITTRIEVPSLRGGALANRV